jgi:hypothetical protein
MADDSFGFFSGAGEAIARTLVRGVVTDVAGDRTSRRRALDRIAEAVERVASVDGMQADQDVIDAIASALRPAFARAKFMPVSGLQLRAHCEEWSRKGASVSSADVCPAAVLEAVAAARIATGLIERMSDTCKVDVFASAIAPYDEGFCDKEGRAPGEVVLFPWLGATGGETYIGCVLVGEGGCAYIEDVVECGPLESLKDGLLGTREPEMCTRIAHELSELNTAIRRFNLASAAVQEPSRLTARVANGGFGLHVMWDGDLLSLQAPAMAASSSTGMSAVAEAVSALGFEGEGSGGTPAMR